MRRDRYATTNHYANQGKYQHIQGMKFVILMARSCSIQEGNIESESLIRSQITELTRITNDVETIIDKCMSTRFWIEI